MIFAQSKRPWLFCTKLHWLAFLVALSGCTGIPTYSTTLPETPTPSAWSADVATTEVPTSLARWWLRFKDPLLSKLVVQALQANTTVRTAQSALQQARATRDVKAANLFPTVGASVSSQSSQTAGSDASNTFKTGFDASWEPDVFGAKRSARDATEAEANAAETHLGDVQISIAAEVAQTYIELRGLQARLAIARNNLVSQNETLQITQWRVQAGLASSLDLEQARTASALTSAQIPSLDIAAVQTQNSLSILTGQAPGALQAVLDATPPSLQAPADLALSIPAHTLRQRPDVRTAEFRISAALSRVSQAEAARYPGFQISGFLGLSSLSTGGISTALAATNSLLASVAVPLFDGGAARAEIRAQEAALEQSRIAYEATVLTALKDVEDALKALQGDRERLEWLQVAAQAAANADLLARQRYGSGLIDFRSVLETQRTLLSTQDSVESTRVSLISDHVRLYKALGGGWVAATATDRL